MNPIIHQGVTVIHKNNIMARVISVDKTRINVLLLQEGKLTAHEQHFTEEDIASVFVCYKARNSYYLQYDYTGLFAGTVVVRSKRNDEVHSACYAFRPMSTISDSYPAYIRDYAESHYDMLYASDNYKLTKFKKEQPQL